MARTVIGLFDRIEDARDTVNDLVQAGFDRERISLVAHDADERYASEVRAGDDGEDVGKAVAGGAATGGVLGGIAGVLIGLDAVAIPGVGPILAVGPIAAGLAGAGIGAATGGLVGGLAEAGVSEDEAHIYAEGVRRGGTLVTVNTDDNLAGDARDIMDRHDPVDIEERASQWRSEGWERHDPNADPYSAEQVRVERERMLAGRRR